MRIVDLELTGFRGFSRTQYFDLNADAVLLVATNGQGKTSIFDAILWCLSGNVPRLGPDDKKLICLYSDSGEMQVRLTLRDSKDETFQITRSSDGEQQRLMLEVGVERFKGASARTRLLEKLFPPALAADDVTAAFSSALTRCIYLQQDLVRHFIESEKVQERFNAISELVGSGRVTDLQIQLDNSRSAWTKATNVRAEESASVRERVLSLEAQLVRIDRTSGDRKFGGSEWDGWWHQAKELGIGVGRIPTPESSEAPLAIDSAIKRLQAKRNSNERTKALITGLIADIDSHSDLVLPDVKSLKKKLEDIERELSTAKALLKKAQDAAAEERRKQVVLQSTLEELKALAELALRHLGDRCPVCDQSYDKPRTVGRLEQILRSTAGATSPPDQEQIAKLAISVEQHERAFFDAQAALGEAERALRAHAAWLAERDRRLQEVGIDTSSATDLLQVLEKRLTDVMHISAELAKQQENGEKLALLLAESIERARQTEVERELSAAQSQLRKLEEQLTSREQTSDRATLMLDALREAATDIVNAELTRIEPLLQRIYARVDPHPSFRFVKFSTSFAYRRGRLSMLIFDPSAQISSKSPEAVLSSSQLNALAVSVFLALNLGVSRLPLQTAMLDDPLQSFDDINLLGVFDLLRRTKDARQLIISTHDIRFGRVLERKLRPIKSEQRTRVIELDGWTREGPLVVQREVEQDVKPLKIAV